MFLSQELKSTLTDLASLREVINHLADAIGLPEELKKDFFRFADRLDELSQGASDREAIESASFSDYCLKALLVSDFRKYGKVTNGADSYFGMEAQDADLLVLLGDNGSGKSSIFDAAEYLFTGKIGEAEYRACDANAFCRRGDNGPEIIALTRNENTIKSDGSEIPDSLKSLPLPYFFISENSIYQAGKMLDGENFFPYFCELLGLGDVYRFVSGEPADDSSILEKVCQHIEAKYLSLSQKPEILLNELTKKVREIQRLLTEQDQKELKRRLGNIEKVYEEWQTLSVDELDISEQLKKVNHYAYLYLVPEFRDWISFSQDLRSRIPKLTVRSRSLKEALAKRKAVAEFDKAKSFQEMKTALKQLIDNINGMLSHSSSDQDFQEIIDLSLKYKQMLDSRLLKDLPEDKMEILSIIPSRLRTIGRELIGCLESYVSEIIDNSFKAAVNSLFNGTFLAEGETITIGNIENHTLRIDVNGVSINKYFNTFRYRMFFLIMQTTICLRIMKSNKVLFPIMLDDIFYANDYHNKTELCKFFKVVFDTSSKMLGNGIKPQIIFLSHDELLVMTMNQKGVGESGKVVYGRLLDLSNVEKIEMTKRPLSDDEESSYKYRNIYIPIYQNG